MIKTVVTPKNNSVCISIPNSYVGKELEVLLYTTEEAGKERESDATMAIYKGILTPEEAEELQEYVKRSRDEWTDRI